MPDYTKGRVYVVHNTFDTRKYVGSTTGSLAKRMGEHRWAANHGNERPLYVAMREHGVDKFYIQHVKDYACERKEQLNAEEGRVMREMNTLAPNGYNLFLAGRKTKEWIADNKERYDARVREYRATHQEELKAYFREQHAKNRDTNNAKRREYRSAHLEAEAAAKKAYYETHKAEVIAKVRDYQAAHAEERKTQVRAFRVANAAMMKERARAFREAHADEIRATDRARYAANREARIARQKAYDDAKRAAMTLDEQVAYREAKNARVRERNAARRNAVARAVDVAEPAVPVNAE